MVQSRLTKTLATITQKLKWPDSKQVGYKGPDSRNKYYNPMLTPPPRSPTTVDDFKNPHRKGHWKSHGFSYNSQLEDKYTYHELMFGVITGGSIILWLFSYGPDLKMNEWARREAYLRTHKREALGLPLIDRNVVDPERIVLPTEEEIGDFPVHL